MAETMTMTYAIPRNRNAEALRAVQATPGVLQGEIQIRGDLDGDRVALRVDAVVSDAIPDPFKLRDVANQALDDAGIAHELIGNGPGIR